MAQLDYSTWIPKAQAAEAIGVSTKRVEQLAQAGELHQAKYRRPTGGPQIVVYAPEDVTRLAAQYQPGLKPFVVPSGAASNGHGASQALTVPDAVLTGEDMLQAFVSAARTLAAQSQNSANTLRQAQLAELRERSANSYCTIPEAALWKGLSEAYLRRAIREDRLPAVKDRGWKIRKTDLEAL